MHDNPHPLSQSTGSLDNLEPDVIRAAVQIARDVRRGPRGYLAAPGVRSKAIDELAARGAVTVIVASGVLHVWRAR